MNSKLLVNGLSSNQSSPLGTFRFDRATKIFLAAVALRILTAPHKFSRLNPMESFQEVVRQTAASHGAELNEGDLSLLSEARFLPEPFRSSVVASTDGNLKQNRTAAYNVVRYLLASIAADPKQEGINNLFKVAFDIFTNPKNFNQRSITNCILGKVARSLGYVAPGQMPYEHVDLAPKEFWDVFSATTSRWPAHFHERFIVARQDRTRALIAVEYILFLISTRIP